VLLKLESLQKESHSFICSSEEQDLCVHQRLSVEGRVKGLEEEVAQMKVNLEQQRNDNDVMKKTLETKDEGLKEMRKEKEKDYKAANLCKTELVCLKFLYV